MEYTETERRILDMWPKFEDGAPVMYEDEFQLGGEVKTAYGFNFGVGGRVSICSDKGSHVRLPNGEHVKRPAPKVLDADGVRILKGELLYGVGRSEHLFSVLDPYHIDPELGSAFSVRCIDLTEAEECHCKPELLAHAPEVLDADGVPIKVGDTVYDAKGEGHIVKEVYFDDDESHEHTVWCGEFKSGIPVVYIADQLTHTRPDSWERLEEDAEKSTCEYFGFRDKECSECPGLKGGVKGCSVIKMLDLIRRAKALAEKEAAR